MGQLIQRRLLSEPPYKRHPGLPRLFLRRISMRAIADSRTRQCAGRQTCTDFIGNTSVTRHDGMNNFDQRKLVNPEHLLPQKVFHCQMPVPIERAPNTTREIRARLLKFLSTSEAA